MIRQGPESEPAACSRIILLGSTYFTARPRGKVLSDVLERR